MISDKWKEVLDCPLCNITGNFKPLYQAKDPHYCNKGVFPVFECRSCSLVFLNPMPQEEELNKCYPADYYSYQNVFEKKRNYKTVLKKLLFLNMGTKDPVSPKPGRVLDIGCGVGVFLLEMRKKHWETYGVEINEKAAKLGRCKAGLNISTGNLVEASFPDNYFDYIRSNHSFEHMVNPNEVLEEIYRILKSNGKLLIGVPNIDGLNAKLFKQYWWYLGAPVHPFNYSVKTLSMILEKQNFVIEKVSYNSDYSGILGSMQIFLNRHTDKLSHEGMIFNNPALKILSHWMSKALDLLKKGDAIEIIAHKGKR